MILNSIEEVEYRRYTEQFDFTEFIKDKNFLITGSGGMTGNAIVKWILYENATHGTNAKIFASTRNPDIRPDYIDENDNIKMCRFGSEEEDIGNESIDYVIHSASPTEREFFMTYPVETFNIIIDGTRRMLEIAKNKKAKFILLSSVEVYGAMIGTIPETVVGAIDSLNIRNGYPLGKKGAEFLTYAYSREYNCDVRIVRISAIQGLYQSYDEQRIFNEITRCILENKNLVMKSDGNSKKSIVYTMDAVSAVLISLFKGERGEAYNVTNPETFVSMREMAEKLFARFNDELIIEYDIAPESQTGYLPHMELLQDISKISEIGWMPITDLMHIYEIDIERWKK